MGFCCFGSVAEVGSRVSARRPRYLFFASPKKSTQKKGDPAGRVPSLRYGQPAMLEAGVRRRTPCAASARQLRSNSFGESDNDARVLRHALTPASALLGTSRRDWGPHTGHCFARPDLPRYAWPEQGDSARASAAHSASPTPGAAAKAAAVWYPLPTPAGCAEKRRSWGGCMCRRTHALRRLARRCCLSGVRRTQRVHRRPPQIRASQAAPGCPTGRTGDADWGPPSLW